MGLSEDTFRSKASGQVEKEGVVRKRTDSSMSNEYGKEQKRSRNVKQILVLSFDALRERKASANHIDGYSGKWFDDRYQRYERWSDRVYK